MSGPVRPPRRKRWGLRTLGFLVLGIAAVLTAQALGGHTPGTIACIVIALIGAGYSSARGLQVLLGGGARRRP